MSSIDQIEKPIFLVTHPRAISTAFERVFLTREHDVVCIHEPFSDAYHWGPEKISARYDDVEKRRQEKGFIQYTYRTAFTLINDAKVSNPNKRVFVKDMAKCLMPLEGNHSYIVPSLLIDSPIEQALVVPRPELGTFNPTVVPLKILSEFHFTFLIRNPLRSIPSLYKCSIPPKSLATGWHGFKPSDAGYREMRILFDYLRSVGQIGPHSNNEICVVDADDLLRFPEEVLRRYCLSIHLPFTPSSMHWDKERDQQRALDTFKNWAPFHDVALHSTCLKPSSSEVKSIQEAKVDWICEFGQYAADLIEDTVNCNMEHYLYLKEFAFKSG